MRYVRLTSLPMGLFALVLALSGCTLKSSDSRMLKITLPERIPAPSSNLSGLLGLESPSSSRAYTAPQATLSGYSCFGINVMGPGIFPDPRMNCNGAASAGIVAGFVPIVNGAQISLDVPSGPARRVQLFAATTTIGCPDMDYVLNQLATNQGRVKDVEQPFLIAETTVDLFNDTEVVLDARNYNAATAQPMFDNCGNHGTTVPLSSAASGYFSAVGPSSTIISPLTGGLLSTPTPLGAVDMGLMKMEPDNGSGLPAYSGANSYIYNAPPAATAYLNRAAVQLVWDVTNYDLSKVQVIDIQLQVAGGSDCTNFSNSSGVMARVYTNAFTWDPGSFNNYNSGNLGWSSIYRGIPSFYFVPCSVVGRATGTCVVADVESNIAADMNCLSKVIVGGAQLTLYETPPPLELDYSPKTGPIYAGLPINFWTKGGYPLYTFYDNGTQITPMNGQYAPGTLGSHTVTVIDSLGQSASVSFTVQPAPVLTISTPASILGSNCMPIVLNSSHPAPSGGFSIQVSDRDSSGFYISPQGTFYDNPYCTGTSVSSAAITANQTSQVVWYKDGGFAGNNFYIQADFFMTSSSTNITFNASSVVTPTYLHVIGPSSIAANVCVGFSAITTKPAGELQAATAATTVSLSTAALGAAFYSDSTCQNVIHSVSVPVGNASEKFYFMTNTNQTGQTIDFSATNYTGGSFPIAIP